MKRRTEKKNIHTARTGATSETAARYSPETGPRKSCPGRISTQGVDDIPFSSLKSCTKKISAVELARGKKYLTDAHHLAQRKVERLNQVKDDAKKDKEKERNIFNETDKTAAKGEKFLSVIPTRDEDVPVLTPSSRSTPLEILARGPLALRAYQKALEEGKTTVKRVPIMFIGQGHSGKTSLKRSLKGEQFNPEESSTAGIEKDPSYCKVTTEIWKMGGTIKKRDSDPMPISFEKHTAQYILNNLKEEEEKKKNETSKKIKRKVAACMKYGKSTSFPDNKEHSSQTSVGTHLGISYVSHFDALLPVPEDTSLPEVPELPEKIAALIEKLLQAVDSDRDEDEIYSTLWYFGGQSVYYTTHPLFLTTRGIYLLVYKLSRKLNETVSPLEKQGFFKPVKDAFCEKSNMDYLDFWMSSISSMAPQDDEPQDTSALGILPDRLPAVFLVCTHADECAHPEELARHIFGSLQTKKYGNHLLDFFFVDNTKSGGEEECSEVTRLREEVLNVAKELPQMKEAIPIKWLKYEKAVQALLEDGYKWISLDKAMKIAFEVCKISSEEQFLTLLNFLHDQRILIHFDDTPELNKMVILDPQWLVDVFKKIITITPYKSSERKFAKLWLRLETTGILDERLLQHIWGPLFDNRETCASLIAMMEKFCLLCPCPSTNGSQSPNEYLVPSMLMFPPMDDVTKLIASAGIPSLFLRFKSGHVAPGLFPRLVLSFTQWCAMKGYNQSHPQLHQNFARFYTHPAEGCSIILLCHSSSIEVIVHKENSIAEVSSTLPPRASICSEFSHDTFQVKVARCVRRQLGLILECMRKQFYWLKNMTYEMSVCCPVCCTQGSVNHCRSHHVRSCTEEECLHFWSESQLHDSQGPVVCTRCVGAGDYRVPLKLFSPWFAFLDEQRAINGCNGRALPCDKGDVQQDLSLPNEVVESLQAEKSDANGVLAQLKESLSLKQASLKQPDPETKRWIRCVCSKAKSANRLDVVNKLRDIAPAGTTGPLLPDDCDVRNIPVRLRQELTINLCGGDEWKLLAEKLGLTPADIRYLDKRVMNPCDAALAHSRDQGYIHSVGELYDMLVDCDLPVLADLL